MELERSGIERKDFPAARRGYDPDEVDRHLQEIADAVTELKRQATRKQPEPSRVGSIAGAAAEQVRAIVEAAEKRGNTHLLRREPREWRASRGKSPRPCPSKMRVGHGGRMRNGAGLSSCVPRRLCKSSFDARRFLHFSSYGRFRISPEAGQ